MNLPGFHFDQLLLFFINKAVNLILIIFSMQKHSFILNCHILASLQTKQIVLQASNLKSFSPPFKALRHLNTETLRKRRVEPAVCQQVVDSHSECSKCEHLIQKFGYIKPRTASENITELFYCVTKMFVRTWSRKNAVYSSPCMICKQRMIRISNPNLTA